MQIKVYKISEVKTNPNNPRVIKDEKFKQLVQHVPGYDAIIDYHNDSLLFYPAYKNIHGVSEIIPTAPGGYRNSLVLYPLNINYGNS